MKSIHFILALLIILLICFSFPIYFDLKGKDFWDLAFKSASAVISLFAVCLGFYLYKRSITADRLQQNKTDAVVNMLNSISLPIILDYDSTLQIIRMREPFAIVQEHYFEYMMRFPSTYSKHLNSILEAGYNIYFPKEPTPYVDKIRPIQFRKIPDEGFDARTVKIRVVVESGRFEEVDYGLINEKEMTFLEWLTSWDELNEKCISWLREHGGKNIDI